MKKIPLFCAALFICFSQISASTWSPSKEVITVVGSDITALWTTYYLQNRIEQEGRSQGVEIHLIGKDLDFTSGNPELFPMMMCGNLLEMLREGKSKEEIQTIIGIQSHNQKLTQAFLSKFDSNDWEGKRTGSYLGVRKINFSAEEHYLNSYFNYKLPLTLCTKDSLPPNLYTLYGANQRWNFFHIPFDALINGAHLHTLLLSSLLEERTGHPQVILHNNSCHQVKSENNEIILTLDQGEILSTDVCVINLEKDNLSLLQSITPEKEYEMVLQVIMSLSDSEHPQTAPYFVQFPSEDFVQFYGEGKAGFYRKLVGICYDEFKRIMIEDLNEIISHIDECSVFTLYRPLSGTPEIRYPSNHHRLIVIDQDQSERFSQGASLGELASNAALIALDEKN